ncbi:hypothetical protein NQ317_014160 [Molorchus minor]|uniref:Helitron helicase-like domain-containing protein n=1 Tax=Molorchus minor TaxID=1323400 RepID=A0ABQ9IQX5_9CUCU|nr:hypothetical protein NQ317_014160 [Molorchus minor]
MAHVYARPHHMLQTEEEVLDIVEDDPSTSTREIARQVPVDYFLTESTAAKRASDANSTVLCSAPCGYERRGDVCFHTARGTGTAQSCPRLKSFDLAVNEDIPVCRGYSHHRNIGDWCVRHVCLMIDVVLLRRRFTTRMRRERSLRERIMLRVKRLRKGGLIIRLTPLVMRRPDDGTADEGREVFPQGRELIVRLIPLPIRRPDDVPADGDRELPDVPAQVRPVVRGAPPPRRRHAAVPRRVTHRRGITMTADALEVQCGAPYTCGALNENCRRCGARFFEREFKNRQGQRQICCKLGKVSLPALQCPPEFRALFTEDEPRTVEFLSNVRAANSMFAMATFKTSAPNARAQGQGRWGFSICGQIYHHTVGVPGTQELRQPVLSHYYFVDAEEVLERRNDMLGDRVGRDTILLIERVLRRENPYVRAYKAMGEVMLEDRQRYGGEGVRNVIIGFSRTGDMNRLLRQHNLPESRSEIAAIFYGDEPPFDVDLRLYPREIDADGDVQVRHHELKNLHPMADPMVYPLLFPCGENGWSIGMVHNDHRITMREFYRYRLQMREGFSLLHNGGKLFQQYVVDAWVRVEADYLWWIRTNQARFRYVQGQAMRRALLGNPDDRLRMGRAIVLPSGLGKKPEHRPDLVCRVFNVKFQEFLDDVVTKQIYGVVLNYHYVIEFQKRGLPHAHMVVTFVDDERIRDVEHVDQIVSAVLPDQDAQPRLYELGYPKPFRNDTVLARGGNGRPDYKRPDDGRYGMHGDFRITNQRVVPYNGYALAKYQTHINFEVVGSLASIKYLYKYVSKGADYATVVEEPEAGVDGGPPGGRINVDEVQSYLDCRYVSSMEAAWRILEFKMYDRSHSVMVLPVHLPGGNYVVVDDWEDEGRLGERLDARSKLKAWFALNGDDADARRFKYAEIPEHFVCSVALEVSARAEDLDLFYLRMLLKHVRGATSFEHLRTVNGVLCETFKEACERLHLLENLEEYNQCLGEAVRTQPAHRLRRLFGTIISVLDGERLNGVAALWRRYRKEFVHDWRRRGVPRARAYQMCIEFLDEFLARNRNNVTSGGSSNDEGRGAGAVDGGDVLSGDVNVNPNMYDPASLTGEQRALFIRIILAVGESCGKVLPLDFIEEFGVEEVYRGTAGRRRGERLFYVDGPGGTGKTYLYNTIVTFLRRIWNVNVVVAERRFIEPFVCLSTFRRRLWPVTIWKPSGRDISGEAGILLWDEAPMSHRYAVEAVDRYFKELMGRRDVAFGASRLWEEFSSHRLSRNMRLAGAGAEAAIEPDLGGMSFGNWLLALGEGRLPYVSLRSAPAAPNDLVEIPVRFRCGSVDELIEFVFENNFLGPEVAERAVLCPTNAAVKEVNDRLLERIEGDSRTYVSVDAIECRLLTGSNRGRTVVLPRIKMIARDTMLPQELIRIQFPVRLAYGITINKAQGQTLSRVGIYLKRPCFGHGQLYVAFSRVRSADDVRVFVENCSAQGTFAYRTGRTFTRNVVYHSILREDDPVLAELRRRPFPQRVVIDEEHEGGAAAQPLPQNRPEHVSPFADQLPMSSDDEAWADLVEEAAAEQLRHAGECAVDVPGGLEVWEDEIHMLLAASQDYYSDEERRLRAKVATGSKAGMSGINRPVPRRDSSDSSS